MADEKHAVEDNPLTNSSIPRANVTEDTPDTPTNPTTTTNVIVPARVLVASIDTPATPPYIASHVTNDGGVLAVFKRNKPTIKSRYEVFQPVLQKVEATQIVDSEEYYPMSSYPRGEMVLLNNKHFEEWTGLSKDVRDGTDSDAAKLVSLFNELGFVVHRHDDVNKSEMKRILCGMARKTFARNTSFFCAILSHGHEGNVYATDKKVRISDLASQLRGSAMAGIPKVFLIQACRGAELMESVTPVSDAVDGIPSLFCSSETKVTLPIEADFLYVYATASGYNSWRNSDHGSWFIQATCAIFRAHAHKMDVVRMFTRVHSVVAQQKSRTRDPSNNDKRQICSIVSQLRKELYLFPPNGPLSERYTSEIQQAT